MLPRPHLPSVWQEGPKGGRAGPSRRQPAGAVEIMSARRHAEGGCARGLHLPPAVSRRVLDTRYRWPTALPLSRGGGGPDATQLDASCKGPPARGAAQPPHTSWWLEPNERGRHSQATRPRRLGPQLSRLLRAVESVREIVPIRVDCQSRMNWSGSWTCSFVLQVVNFRCHRDKVLKNCRTEAPIKSCSWVSAYMTPAWAWQAPRHAPWWRCHSCVGNGGATHGPSANGVGAGRTRPAEQRAVAVRTTTAAGETTLPAPPAVCETSHRTHPASRQAWCVTG